MATIYSDSDATSVLAAGDLVLEGDLAVDVQGDLTQGTVWTIMDGSGIEGTFRGLGEGAVLTADGHQFRVSDQDDSVSLTVIRGPSP